ncbi:hypothetical protein MTO96_007963 [Rhipicephalus appendiculatus]
MTRLCLIELVTWQRPCPDSLYACLYRWAGEAAAFAAGWLSLLHQGAAVACVARLQSSAIDALSGGALARAWQALGSYDPVALALGLVAASVAAAPRLLSSSREPTWLGMALIVLSLLAALFFVAMGSVGATAAPGKLLELRHVGAQRQRAHGAPVRCGPLHVRLHRSTHGTAARSRQPSAVARPPPGTGSQHGAHVPAHVRHGRRGHHPGAPRHGPSAGRHAGLLLGRVGLAPP